jgi:hypothetical protein
MLYICRVIHGTMLTGSDLIDALRSAPAGATETDRIRLTGYVYSKNGKTSLNRAGYYKALATADEEGRTLAGLPAPGPRPRGRDLTFQTSVLRPGHAVVGRAYLHQIGVEPGDRLRIVPDGARLTLEKAQS